MVGGTSDRHDTKNIAISVLANKHFNSHRLLCMPEEVMLWFEVNNNSFVFTCKIIDWSLFNLKHLDVL